MHILYSTNTILMEIMPHIHWLAWEGLCPVAPGLWIGPGAQLITALQVKSYLIIDLQGYYTGHGEPRFDEQPARILDQIDLLPRAFPNLQHLEWLQCGFTNEFMERVRQWDVDKMEEFLLRPLLQAGTKMPRMRELLVALPRHLFFPLISMEQHAPAPRQDFTGQKLCDIRIWYPFTERRGEPGPEGGGLWIVDGERRFRRWEYNERDLE